MRSTVLPHSVFGRLFRNQARCLRARCYHTCPVQTDCVDKPSPWSYRWTAAEKPIASFGIQSLFHQVKNGEFSVEEVDKLTGTAIGRPKSATFRTADVVGLDTLCHVATGIYDNCPEDESRNIFKLPDFLKKMLDKKMLGSKTKQGFYKKVVGSDGKSKILSLDLKTFEYKEQKKTVAELWPHQHAARKGLTAQ